MMQASERTMQRLAHELHDDLGQALTSVKMQLGLIERGLPSESAIRPPLAEARGQVGSLLQSVRNLSQLLRPAVLDDLGLVPAMQSYVTRFSERTGTAVRLHCGSPDTRLPAPIEVALYRVLQEALTNIARHAEARQVDVQLTVDAETAALRIRDDGRGFDAAAFLENPPAGHGMGVLGMRERVATYGGRFDVRSRPGQGTVVELSISLTQPIQDTDDDSGEDSRLAG
jgi:signal transduction histidine kinase